MADVGKPTRSRKKKGTPPPADVASANLKKLSDADQVGMSFKVPAEFRKEMKGYANNLGISMTELLIRSVHEYKERH